MLGSELRASCTLQALCPWLTASPLLMKIFFFNKRGWGSVAARLPAQPRQGLDLVPNTRVDVLLG